VLIARRIRTEAAKPAAAAAIAPLAKSFAF